MIYSKRINETGKQSQIKLSGLPVGAANNSAFNQHAIKIEFVKLLFDNDDNVSTEYNIY